MSGLHLVKQGRDRRRIDLQRDFTVASPAEFVTRFGGNRVIEKVRNSDLKKKKPPKNPNLLYRDNNFNLIYKLCNNNEKYEKIQVQIVILCQSNDSLYVHFITFLLYCD